MNIDIKRLSRSGRLDREHTHRTNGLMNGHSQDWFEIACVRTGFRNSHWIAILFIIGRESRIVIKTHPGQILSGVTEQHIKIEVGNSLCSLKQIGVLRTLTGNFVFLVHMSRV